MGTDVIRTRIVQTSNLRFNVREAGRGPLAVLLHGITANGAVWDPLIDLLAPSFHVVAPDQRGHGLSSKPSSGYRAADFAADVADLIEAIGEGPAVVIGHSLGAQNALAAGALYHSLVSGVVAIEFCPYIEEERLATMASRVASGDSHYLSPSEVLSYLAERYPLLPGAALLRRTKYGYNRTPQGYEPRASAAAMALAARSLFDDLEETTKSCQTAALLIRGHESKFVSPTAFARTQVLRPDFEYREVAETDHHVPEERPIEVFAIIADFAVRHGLLNARYNAV